MVIIKRESNQAQETEYTKTTMEAAPSPIQVVGMNPNHPDAPTILSPEEAMEQAQAAIHDWNETVMPKISPIAEDLWHQASDLWHVEKNEPEKRKEEKESDEIPHQFQDAWQGIFNETAVLKQQVEEKKTRLVNCKQNIQHALQADPECTKYMSAILKLPIFTPPCPEAQKELDHYYNNTFLHQYENAMEEYEELLGYPTGLLRRIENVRKYELNEIEHVHHPKGEKKSIFPFL
jgi:hypothetical protein